MTQKANIAGQGNVIIQIIGDGNTIDSSKPHLRLTTYPKSGASLLPPNSNFLIPFAKPPHSSAARRIWTPSGNSSTLTAP